MNINPDDIRAILDNKDPKTIEDLAQKSANLTRQYFGQTISLYAPLYLSNYCSSHCTYCGFHSKNNIKRVRLTPVQIEQEMNALSKSGIENVLMLTGESYKATPTEYLKQAAQIARKHFTSIAIEVHPMETHEYKELFDSGIDGVAIYQETYLRDRYKEVHLDGKKADYDFRYGAPERAAQAGFRHISLGILLGLSDDIAQDLSLLYTHLRFLEKHYPGVEYSLSFPRIRTIKGREFALCLVDDATFVKIICLTRLLFPRVGINLSTREAPQLRDRLIHLGVTRMSAGSNTAVGGYELLDTQEQEPQFDISDHRGVADIIRMLKDQNFDPILTDWRPIANPSE